MSTRDEDSDEDRADRVGDHPAEGVHQQGGDDDADAAEGVRQDVQEHTLKRFISTSLSTNIIIINDLWKVLNNYLLINNYYVINI